ncbi:MAG: hypothetical protein J6S71_01925 [Clostridia bacterium]|nr:hypothetical protein [Clostridia bacterium]
MNNKPIKLYTECGNHPVALLTSGAEFFFYAIMCFILALIVFHLYFPLALTLILMALSMIALWAFVILSNYVIFDGDEIRFYSGFKHKKTFSKSSVSSVKYLRVAVPTRAQSGKRGRNHPGGEILCVYNADDFALFYVADDNIAREFFRKEFNTVIDVTVAFFGDDLNN